MRMVIALGGHALLQRGEPVSAETQRAHIRIAAHQMARIAAQHDLVIVHGNGPQVGLLALQTNDASYAEPFPLDVLDAETEGMIGYLIEQELSNALPEDRACATLLTMVEVDPDDTAFQTPDKPIGPVYSETSAQRFTQCRGWTFAQTGGDGYRRVVPSPHPQRIVEMQPIRWLLEKGTVLICAGGGGIPVIRAQDGTRHGIEAVIDKDRCAALLAHEVDADLLVIATDVPAVFADWGQPAQRPILHAHPEDLGALRFEAGSMQPKVEAACAFSRRPGRRAVIGALAALEPLVKGTEGTQISTRTHGIEYGPETHEYSTHPSLLKI